MSNGDAPRPYTVDEARDAFMRQLATMAHYWGTIESIDGPKTALERCNGLAFSILSNLDGASLAHPAIDLSMAPHPEDKEYHITEGENYYEPGVVFNDCQLHELWYSNYERTV